MPFAPPISQLLLTLRFEPAAVGLSILDLGKIRELFSADYPVFQEVARAGPMPLHPANVEPEVGGIMPRLQFLSEDLSLKVLFQDDRVTVGWSRVSPLDQDADYPGFSVTLSRLIETYTTIARYLKDIGAADPSPATGEVFYVDAFNMLRPDGTLTPLEEVFTFYRSNEAFGFNQLSFVFRRIYEEPFEGQSETGVSGYYNGPNGEVMVTLQTVVRFGITDADTDLVQPFKAAHKIANETFSVLVKPDSYAI